MTEGRIVVKGRRGRRRKHLHGYTVHQTMLKTFSLPTDAHNVKKTQSY